jgi:hypothetical protein
MGAMAVVEGFQLGLLSGEIDVVCIAFFYIVLTDHAFYLNDLVSAGAR